MSPIIVKPEPKLKALWQATNLILFVIVLLIPVIMAIVSKETTVVLWFGGIIIFIFLLVAIYIPAFFKTLEYTIDAEGVKLKKGVFWRRRTTVPFSKITNIDITQGPLERMLGFSRIHIQTAGSNSSETRKAELLMDGIRDCEALRTLIMRQIAVPAASKPATQAETSSEAQLLTAILTELSEIKLCLERK